MSLFYRCSLVACWELPKTTSPWSTYSTDLEGNTRLINRELVDRGAAAWVELASVEGAIWVWTRWRCRRRRRYLTRESSAAKSNYIKKNPATTKSICVSFALAASLIHTEFSFHYWRNVLSAVAYPPVAPTHPPRTLLIFYHPSTACRRTALPPCLSLRYFLVVF